MSNAGQSPGEQPLSDLSAERNVLSILLKSDKPLPEEIADMLEPEDFIEEKNLLIYRAVSRLYERRESINRNSVIATLSMLGLFELDSDEKYIDDLMDPAQDESGLAAHAKTIQQLSLRRRLLYTGENILRESRAIENPEMALAGAQNALARIASRHFKDKTTRLSVITEDNKEVLERQYARGSMLTGLPTGFHRLNALTLGYQKDDLIIVGGLPGMGKTAFALNLASYLSLRDGYSIAFFSLESTKEQIGFRLQCMEARVNLLRLREGRLSRDDKKEIFYVTQRMRDARIYISDTPALTTEEIYAYALQLRNQRELDLLIVDHLSLIGPRGKNGATSKQIGAASEELKRIAVEFKIPVMALCQLSRQKNRSVHREPKLSDLQGGGRVEQNADVVIFLHRPEYHNPETIDKNMCRVIVAKHRNGPLGAFDAGWSAETTRFSDLVYI